MKQTKRQRLRALESIFQHTEGDQRFAVARQIRELRAEVAAEDEAARRYWAPVIAAVACAVVWALVSLLSGCGGAMPAADASSYRGILGNFGAIPDRCACACGPVAVSVGWADGRGKLCAGAGAWRSCWAVGGDQ